MEDGSEKTKEKSCVSLSNEWLCIVHRGGNKAKSEKSKKMKKKSEKAKSGAAAKTSKSGKRETKSKKMNTQRPSSSLSTFCFMHTCDMPFCIKCTAYIHTYIRTNICI